MDEARHDEVTYADDAVPRRLVIYVFIATIAFAVALCAGAYVLLGHEEALLRPSARFPETELGPPHIVSAIHQDVLWSQRPLDRQRARLQRYGWVDRAHGLIHIPIERAMELTLQKGQP
jgi:hypothetical protein